MGHIYDNHNQLRDKFANYWAKVASEFADNPYVLGFELLNEPFPGNIYPNFLKMIPYWAENWILQPFYDIVA